MYHNKCQHRYTEWISSLLLNILRWHFLLLRTNIRYQIAGKDLRFIIFSFFSEAFREGEKQTNQPKHESSIKNFYKSA